MEQASFSGARGCMKGRGSIMLKKIFYIGLGISIIAVKKSVSYFLQKREQAGDQPAADLTVEEVVVSQSDAADTPESDRAQQVADEVDPAAEGCFYLGLRCFGHWVGLSQHGVADQHLPHRAAYWPAGRCSGRLQSDA